MRLSWSSLIACVAFSCAPPRARFDVPTVAIEATDLAPAERDFFGGLTLPKSRTGVVTRARAEPDGIVYTSALTMPRHPEFRLELGPHPFYGQVFMELPPPMAVDFRVPPLAQRLGPAPESGYFFAIDAALDWLVLMQLMLTSHDVSPRPWVQLAVQSAGGELAVLPFRRGDFPAPPTRAPGDRPSFTVLPNKGIIEVAGASGLSTACAVPETPIGWVEMSLDELAQCAADIHADVGDIRVFILPTGDADLTIAGLVELADTLRGSAEQPRFTELNLVLR